MKHHLALLVLLLSWVFVLPSAAAPLSGTRTIGPTGNYASLTAAIADIQVQSLSGALVLELQSTYVGTVETFPLTFPYLGTTAMNTLTVRPQAGATGLTISGFNTTTIVDLNGAQFVTLDGRPGGVGTAKQLTIANTSLSAPALRFINDAGSNTVEYLTVRGVDFSATSGTVVFSTTTGLNGNDNNTMDHCDIGDGATTPNNGIYSAGSTGTTAQNNSGNTVSNCNIFNFNATSDASGVRLDGGNTGWTISGNSFYQTASRATVTINVRAIYINNTSGNNFAVTGNFIGGSAANAGGTAWTTTGTTAAYLFQGIRLNVGTATPSSVQGNTVRNIVWTSNSNASTLPGVWSGIYVAAGAANIGTLTGNTIGSGTGTGSMSVTTSGTGGTAFGIGSASSGTVAIASNTIGSIATNGTTTGISASLVGIQVTAGANTIAGNSVGSTATANSLNATTSATAGGQQVTGILSSSSSSTSITGNTVANLNNNYAGPNAGQVRGIVTSAGVNTITGNTVRNLSTTSLNSFPTTTGSVLGIAQFSTTAGQTLSQNVVHSLSNTVATGSVSVTGIYYAGATTGTNVIARNLVHSLSISSTSLTGLTGMEFGSGTFTAQNNIVRVGLDANGASTAGGAQLRGIYDNGTDAGRNFYHNSVYSGGVQTATASVTYAFISTGVSNNRDFRNNIFFSARSRGGTATGAYLAVAYGGTTPNPAGLTASNNIFFASGTGSSLGAYNSAFISTLSAWQTATGVDAASALVNPRFVIPTGTAATVDLHLQTSNPAEAHGTILAGVTDDFDGQTRVSYTATDIGADAGNFTYATASTEVNPVISHTTLVNTASIANRALPGFATITDDVSVAGSANAPRLYYKKATEADTFGGNTSAANGWKYVTASNAGSPYDFTIDYARLTGGSVAGGDTIQYFVVAQDNANNLTSSPAGAAWSANPPVQNVSARPVAVNSYFVITADLSALALSTGTLSPAFASGATSYTASVPNATTSVIVTPATADPNATMTVNGNSPATPVPLALGANTITVLVTASDGITTKTYTVVLSRLSNNANLSNLMLSVGPLSPAFASGTLGYTVTVPDATTSATVTPTVADSAATVAVNEAGVTSGNASGAISLNTGANTITITVTSQDGVTTKTYSVAVIRGAFSATYNTAVDVPLIANGFDATGLTVNFSLNFAPAPGTTLQIVKNTGPGLINGTFANIAQGQAVTLNYGGVAYNFVANYYGGTGRDFVLQWASVRPMAWGDNSFGQLGNNSTVQSGVPAAVLQNIALSGKIITLMAAGQNHGLALSSDGTVASWGWNQYGQLGNNSFADSHVPVAVVQTGVLSGKRVIAVSAGSAHNVALCSDGTVATWGSNSFGSLGDNGGINRSVPVAVVQSGVLSGKTVSAVVAGSSHSIALYSDGTLAAWGYNSYGQVGNNSTAASTVPVPVALGGVLYGKTVIAVAAGDLHSLALCSDGTLAAWGRNAAGQLGNNNGTQSNVPVAVLKTGALTGKTVIALSAGASYSLALCSDGTLAAWGSNFYGQLGNNSTFSSSVPVAVVQSGVLSGRTVIGVSAANVHSLAQCADGAIAAWGAGYLGNNNTTQSNVPVLVSSAALLSGERFVAGISGQSALHSMALVASPPPPPTITTLAATLITATGVTLNGTVNANNSNTSVSFDYGMTNSYGTNVTGSPTPVTGGSVTAVSVIVTGLTPGTTYHFRLHGLSGAGTANGSDLTFTTLSNNADLTNITLSSGTLNPVFAANTLGYTASVSNPTTSVTVTPVKAAPNAVVTVNSASPATPVTLNLGMNSIAVLVTAQDGTMKTYSVTVTRNTVFQDWALANGVSGNPAGIGANGLSNLLNFAFGLNPNGAGSGSLVFTGTFGAGGSIGANGQPITMLEPVANGVDFRVLYVRRKDFAAAGLTYATEFSPANLAPWTASAAVPPVLAILADDGIYQIVSVPFPPFIGGKKARFFRVRVTQSP